MSDFFVTPWTITHEAPLSMGFLRQEHWSGLPFPPPGVPSNPGVQTVSLALASGFFTTAAAAKSCQSCLTLCDPIDGSPPGSPVPGILQTRTLEWVAISSLLVTTNLFSVSRSLFWFYFIHSFSFFLRLHIMLLPILSLTTDLVRDLCFH